MLEAPDELPKVNSRKKNEDAGVSFLIAKNKIVPLLYLKKPHGTRLLAHLIQIFLRGAKS
ncbi:hypothetical protein SECTIM467_5 [Brevibacillus phage SecTim467]|uniref:Uncharacterized protein n=2 Tax=Jenstvirus jenst TaxID=1982225 RepID=A0A0K2CP94_9CAUD|nr:hypothetical protein AVV11_gp005 [Brevibacillus phage Jenst]ALA07135.1 hypothetical protein JENST_5 [Brevibacillus phage Jenst]ALA07591.1 hypothetical protein SECTIM467_5 [Brevibacillus phage SecTim467]